MGTNLKDKLTNLFMEEANKMFDKIGAPKTVYTEQDEELDEEPKEDKAKVAEPKKPEKEEKKDKNEFDKVDDVVKDIDFSKMKNKGRLELIEIIIDSAQNSEKESDDFLEFLKSLDELIENYLENTEDEEEGEEEKEGGEAEKEAEGGEEAPEAGEEEAAEEK